VIWEVDVQTVMDSVSKMNEWNVEFRNKVVVELWKNIILQTPLRMLCFLEFGILDNGESPGNQ
jgi:hypothetical protein